MEENLHPEITEVIQGTYPGALVTHWSAAVAIVTPAGNEMIVILDRPGQAIWQSLGLETFVSEMRKGAMYSSTPGDDDDD